MSKKTVVFDFDGVIHSYTSGWKREDIIPDPPVPGVKEVIDELITQGYEIVVMSSRAASSAGCMAIREYLDKHQIKVDLVTYEKPPAIVYIDDRAICFDGNAKTLIDKINNFKPWNK